MSRICLISCASSKLPRETKAKELYTSPLFQYGRKVAERDYDRWFILSALHGLVDPEKRITPYNETLSNQSALERESWAANVLKDLLPKLQSGDTITFLAGDNYRNYLSAALTSKGFKCNAPLEGLGLGQQIHTLKLLALEQERLRHLDQFYSMLNRLREVQGQVTLSALGGASKLPLRGMYFFFEPNESRLLNRDQLRCVRVGTHAVSRNASSTLWTRLRTHRGASDLSGNHRSSIFRLHVGTALLSRGDSSRSLPTWGKEQNAPANVRKNEQSLEELVSRFIGNMQVLWLEISDEPGPTSDRSYVERNSIALIAGSTGPFDLASRNWLGLYSTHATICKSGLWNVNYVNDSYDPRFLDVMSQYVDITLGRRSIPNQSLAPLHWFLSGKRGNQNDQLSLFEEE
jgi:hypothetical protein